LTLTATTTQIFFGSTTTPNAAMIGGGFGLNISAGAHEVAGAWVADTTGASIIVPQVGLIDFYAENGLTAGSNFGPYLAATINSNGLLLPQSGGVSSLWWGSYTTPTGTVYSYDAGNNPQVAITAGLHSTTTNYIADSTQAAMLVVTAPNPAGDNRGIDLYAASGLTIGSPANPSLIAHIGTSGFQLNGVWQGGLVAWTPVLGGSGGNPTVTYANQVGKYSQVGSMVWYSLYLSWTAISGGAGALQIPFSFTNGSQYAGTMCYNWSGITSATNVGLQIPNASSVFAVTYNAYAIAQISQLTAPGQLLCEGWLSTS
jgi:hypothetical protein